MIQNVIFDLDGTLIDSSDDVYSCMKKAYRKARVPFTIKSISSYMGGPLPVMIRAISPKLDDSALNDIIVQFRAYYDNISFKGTKLFKGAKALLAGLSSMKVSLFIATNKRLSPTIKILKTLKVYDYFKGVYAFDMKKGTQMSKVEMIGHLLKKHGLNNNKTLLAGDNESDIIAARKNGLISVAVLGGYGDSKNLRKEKPSFLIKNIADLIGLIQKLDREGRS